MVLYVFRYGQSHNDIYKCLSCCHGNHFGENSRKLVDFCIFLKKSLLWQQDRLLKVSYFNCPYQKTYKTMVQPCEYVNSLLKYCKYYFFKILSQNVVAMATADISSFICHQCLLEPCWDFQYSMHFIIVQFYKLWDNTFGHLQIITISNFPQKSYLVAMATRKCQKNAFGINKHNFELPHH